MRITIQDNSLIYIYLKEMGKYVDNISGNPEYRSQILFDEFRNWIGIKILNIDIEGQIQELPRVGDIDYPMHTSIITEQPDSITILFDNQSTVSEIVEEDCILDLHPTGIYGIEVILYETQIEGIEKVRPFIHDH